MVGGHWGLLACNLLDEKEAAFAEQRGIRVDAKLLEPCARCTVRRSACARTLVRSLAKKTWFGCKMLEGAAQRAATAPTDGYMGTKQLTEATWQSLPGSDKVPTWRLLSRCRITAQSYASSMACKPQLTDCNDVWQVVADYPRRRGRAILENDSVYYREGRGSGCRGCQGR